MPEEDYEFSSASNLMTADEIETIARSFVKMGVNKIRLTGGEPLVRKDAGEIIERLAKLPVALTITTNGTRIHQFVDLLQSAGVRSLNVSLDSLNAETFQFITRRNQFDLVYQNIQLLLQRSFHVKVNVVVMKGVNDGEVNDFVDWTKEMPVHVRFIEFMPFEGNAWNSSKVFTWQQILELVGTQHNYLPLKNQLNDTAKGYQVPGHKGTFSVISTMSAPFCSSCNRMRLTADGKMKNCLFAAGETDLLSSLRRGEDIEPLIRKNLLDKAEAQGGQFEVDFANVNSNEIVNRSMIRIGG